MITMRCQDIPAVARYYAVIVSATTGTVGVERTGRPTHPCRTTDPIETRVSVSAPTAHSVGDPFAERALCPF
jgi:hypothetical protein